MINDLQMTLDILVDVNSVIKLNPPNITRIKGEGQHNTLKLRNNYKDGGYIS